MSSAESTPETLPADLMRLDARDLEQYGIEL